MGVSGRLLSDVCVLGNSFCSVLCSVCVCVCVCVLLALVRDCGRAYLSGFIPTPTGRRYSATNCLLCVRMKGFNADAIQPRLRFGDAIYLLPDGVNGIVGMLVVCV